MSLATRIQLKDDAAAVTASKVSWSTLRIYQSDSNVLHDGKDAPAVGIALR